MNLIPSTTDDTLAQIDAGRVIDRIAFSASSMLGAKSLAYQQGIPPEREPDFAHYSAGLWTLAYQVAA